MNKSYDVSILALGLGKLNLNTRSNPHPPTIDFRSERLRQRTSPPQIPTTDRMSSSTIANRITIDIGSWGWADSFDISGI